VFYVFSAFERSKRFQNTQFLKTTEEHQSRRSKISG